MILVRNLKQLLCVDQPLQIFVWNLEQADDLVPLQEVGFDGGPQTALLLARRGAWVPPRDIWRELV